jgi:sarcosine oxidase
MNFDVIVVGGGVMGTCAAYQLAKRGVKTLLLEQYAIGHALGSSHGPHRIIRLAYDFVEYVVLAKAAFALWRELEQDSGQPLLINTGGLDFGAPDALGLKDIGANYAALDVPYEALTGEEITKRYPQIRPPEGSIGFFQQDYSMLAADRCVATAAARARHYGATLQENEGARAIRPTPDGGVTVTTDRATYTAGKVVLCSGSWMKPMLNALGVDVPLVVHKEQVAFMHARQPDDFAVGRFPLFIHRFAGTTQLGSAFPMWGHSGPKVMLDRSGPIVASDDPDRSPNHAEIERLKRYAVDVLPGLTGEVIETVSCRYTMTPDEHFVIDLHPEHEQIVIASPCSGHGFKFAVVIGEILADLALIGRTAYDLSRFKLARFDKTG